MPADSSTTSAAEALRFEVDRLKVPEPDHYPVRLQVEGPPDRAAG
jgi:hypothetical protein